MKLYNTLSRSAQDVTPLQGNTVKLYTCGLTVYSQPHIGNWTGYIYWDVLVRALRATGFTVIRTQNITDVGHLVSDDDSGEDKMEKGAKREGVTAWDVASKYNAIADHEEYGLLGLIRPDYLVRATDYIEQQIAFAKVLEDKGFTYTIPGEGLYFDTGKLESYGELAQLDIAGLEAGARVSVDGKRNITDFAIWKFSPAGQTRDMEWDSPWGKGFPGWHLECSVIARETLGDQIDIHTGGIDHIPVHHTNEIAQTEAVTGKRFATMWVHNNHMKVDGGKMSKSLGNIYTLADITARGYSLQAYKLMVLSKHYRTEGNFTWDNLEAAQNTLDKFTAWADLQFQELTCPELGPRLQKIYQDMLAALQNDLNTQHAITLLNVMVADCESLGPDSAAIRTACKDVDALLGLGLSLRLDITDDQKRLISERESARIAKDWARSDQLRDTLAQQGIEILDTARGTLWHRTSRLQATVKG